MRVKLKTNIDAYRQAEWPILTVVPRKGEYVYVNDAEFCTYHKIPKRLEVVSVGYHQDYVEVELWYNETDYKLHTSTGAKLL